MKTKSFTILNVDDSVEYLRTHSHFLKSEGYKVLEATTGNECLRLTKKHKPDLILLDVVLPDIYGIEVCRQIKMNVDTKQTLILLISGYETESDAQVRGFEAGADDYLVKPIPKDELLAHVRVMERIKRSEDELREAAMMLEQRVKERTKALEKTNQELQNEIAEHKRAEESLRVSEDRYRMLFEGAAEGILVTDIESHQFRYSNPAICKMLGYTAEEMSQLGVADIHPKESLDYIVPEFDAQASGKKIISPEIPCLRKDGSIFYVGIATSPIIINGRKCNVGFFTDITERKRADEEIQKTKEKYRLIAEKTTDVIWLMNFKGESIYVSPSIEKFTGYTVEEYLNQSIDDRFTYESAQIAKNRLFKELAQLGKKFDQLKDYNIKIG